MTERPGDKELIRRLPDQITRQLIVVRGRKPLAMQDLDPNLVENQRQFGRGTDDYAAMVSVHQRNSLPGYDGTERFLGIREEVRKRFSIVVDGETVEVVEVLPNSRNIWVGDHVRLYSPIEAAGVQHAGRTALDWASSGGKSPEMVVKASDGYFYPATSKDIVVPGSKPIR